MLRGVRSKSGFGSPMLYAMAGLLILLIIAGSVIMAQRATIKMYKAENKRLATDNQLIAEAKEKQHEADAKAILYYKEEWRKCTLREHEPCVVIVSDNPAVQIIADEKKDPTLKMLNDLWRVTR